MYINVEIYFIGHFKINWPFSTFAMKTVVDNVLILTHMLGSKMCTLVKQMDRIT